MSPMTKDKYIGISKSIDTNVIILKTDDIVLHLSSMSGLMCLYVEYGV